MKPADLFALVRDSYLAFTQDRAPRLAAALAYYAISSIAPLLFLIVAVAGRFLGREEVQRQIFETIQQSLGTATATFLSGLVQNAAQPSTTLLATIIGAATLFLTTTAFFVQIQDSLNSLWGSNPAPPQSIWRIVGTRIISFVMVLAFGALIIGFLVANTYLAAIAQRLGDLIGFGAFFVRLGTFILSTLLFTPVFAAVYKFLPDIKMQWRDVWVGSAITAMLFTLGQVLIGVYFGRTSAGSVYGAASSLFILLLWLYYSAMIFFFGAEVTWVYSQKHGTQAGGAQNPAKKAALAAQGADVPTAPSAKERAAAAVTPDQPGQPRAPVYRTGRSAAGQDRPLRPQPQRPPLGRALGRVFLGLLALPAILVLELFGLAGMLRRRKG